MVRWPILPLTAIFGGMKRTVAIYLAGTIKKDHEDPNETYWTEADLALLKGQLSDYEVSFLNPALRTDDLSDQRSVFGRDMVQVYCSDVVFVDARDRRGLGVGAEMMWAKVNHIPVVTWAPLDSHYNKSHTSLLDVEVKDWVHPFVEGLSDKIVSDLIEGAAWIRSTISNPSQAIKHIGFIEEAMEYYKASQFHHDRPMQQLLASGSHLKQRLEKLRAGQRLTVTGA
jgi:hypothetical protein